jgi:HlyD family secretion protein/macrolide-specific efflux system membrane fusion protein
MKMKGRVVRIATKGTITSNVVTFEVKVEVLDKNKKLLKPEMTANVAIAVVDKPDALLVPVNAVESSGKGSFVVCKNGGKKERLKVKLGHTDGEMMEVLGGLSEGDRVVVSGNGSSWKGRDNGNRRRRRRGIL